MPDVLDAAGVTPRNIRRYGWKPSLPDLRDHIADASELKVLDAVDPRARPPGRIRSGSARQLHRKRRRRRRRVRRKAERVRSGLPVAPVDLLLRAQDRGITRRQGHRRLRA